MNSQPKFFNESDLYTFFEMIGKEFDDEIRLWLITKVVNHVKNNEVFVDTVNTVNGTNILLDMDMVFEFVNEILMDVLIALESPARPKDLQSWSLEEVIGIVYNFNEMSASQFDTGEEAPSLLAIRMAEINNLTDMSEDHQK